MGTSTIDRSGDRPVYKQLADLIRDQIASGDLPAGADLPAERDLAATYGVSHTTVRQTMGLLRDEGLIVSERGRLTKVRPVRLIGEQRYTMGKANYGADVESAFAREHGVPWSAFDVTREYTVVPAPPRVARNLGLPAGAEVFKRRFTHATGGVTLRLSYSYLDAARFGETVLTDAQAPLMPGGTVAMLSSIGVDVTRVRTEVAARPATPDELAALRLAVGTPVLEAWRVHLAGDEPVETAQHIYPASGGQILVFDIPVGPRPPGNEWYGVSYD